MLELIGLFHGDNPAGLSLPPLRTRERGSAEKSTFYTVWYELRWGITLCLVLTISLITMIFYFHPSTTNVASLFRTVTILPETSGRVAEVFVKFNEQVEAGQPLFKLDSTAEEAALETARSKIAEVEAAMAVAKTQLAAADGQIQQAQGAYQQAVDEYETKSELLRRNASTVSEREVQKLEVAVDGTQGGVEPPSPARRQSQEQIDSLLPAQKASAEAALQEAQVDTRQDDWSAPASKGTVAQFTLRPGDVVNPMLRPAGILDSGRRRPRPGRRLRPDRGAGDEGRHGRRGHLHGEALHHHPGRRHAGSGRHRRRPGQADRPA